MTIRQSIIGDEELKAISGGYQGILDSIHQARTDMHTAEKILADYRLNGVRTNRERVDVAAAEIAYEVSIDTSLKNAEQRKASLTERLSKSADYRDARADLLKSEQTENDLAQKIAKHKTDLEFFRYQFSAWQSRMALAASLGQEQQEHRFVTSAEISIGGIN